MAWLNPPIPNAGGGGNTGWFGTTDKGSPKGTEGGSKEAGSGDAPVSREGSKEKAPGWRNESADD